MTAHNAARKTSNRVPDPQDDAAADVGLPETVTIEIAPDEGNERYQDDPSPDIYLDDLEAEHEAEREQHRAGIERRVLAAARLLQGLTRPEIHDVLMRARALARPGQAQGGTP